ncbi:hypothetical protein HDU96_005860 [Phlyctochytrium bullatum]|nr:hypothetical protein HDU96_005860 [Phlyctochytrium bullatum]
MSSYAESPPNDDVRSLLGHPTTSLTSIASIPTILPRNIQRRSRSIRLLPQALRSLAENKNAEAEQMLRNLLDQTPESVEIKLHLATALERQDKATEAAELVESVYAKQPANVDFAFRGMLAVPSFALPGSHPLQKRILTVPFTPTTSAAELHARAASITGSPSAIAKGLALIHSSHTHTPRFPHARTRTHAAKPPAAAAAALASLYRSVADRGIRLPTPLLETTVLLATQNDALAHPTLHTHLFATLVAEPTAMDHASAYFRGRREVMRGVAGWWRVAWKGIGVLEKGEKEGERTAVKMEVLWRVGLAAVAEGSSDTQDILTAYQTAVDALDDAIPDDDARLKTWSVVKQEHVARLQLLRTLRRVRGEAARDAGVCNLKLAKAELNKAIREAVKSCGAGLAFRPAADPANGLDAASISTRLSLTAHVLLSLLACFTPSYLSPPPGRALPAARKEEGGLAVGIGCAWGWPGSDPRLRAAAAAGGNGKESAVAGVAAAVEWVLGGAAGPKARARAKLGFSEVEKHAFLGGECLDLEKALVYAAWHAHSGRLREWLRELFQRMPERPKYATGAAAAEKPTRRLAPTVADMEAFLLILLTYRVYGAVLEESAATMGDVLYLAEVGRGWGLTANQKGFWKKAIGVWGGIPQAVSMPTTELSDAEFARAIQEIRGVVAPPGRRFHQLVFAQVGLVLAAAATGKEAGASAAVGSPAVGTARLGAEAGHYLELAGNGWGAEGEKKAPEGEKNAVVLVEINVAEYEEVCSEVEMLASEALARVRHLPEASGKLIDEKISRDLMKGAAAAAVVATGRVVSKSGFGFLPSSPAAPSPKAVVAPATEVTTPELREFAVVSTRSSPSGKSVRSAFSRGSFSESGVRAEAGGSLAARRLSDSDDGWVRDGWMEEVDSSPVAAAGKRVVVGGRPGVAGGASPAVEEAGMEAVDEAEAEDDGPPPPVLLDTILSEAFAEMKIEKNVERKKKLNELRRATGGHTPAALRRWAVVDPATSMFTPAERSVGARKGSQVGGLVRGSPGVVGSPYRRAGGSGIATPLRGTASPVPGSPFRGAVKEARGLHAQLPGAGVDVSALKALKIELTDSLGPRETHFYGDVDLLDVPLRPKTLLVPSTDSIITPSSAAAAAAMAASNGFRGRGLARAKGGGAEDAEWVFPESGAGKTLPEGTSRVRRHMELLVQLNPSSPLKELLR